MNSSQVWKDQEAPAIALVAIFVAKYGTEAMKWEPEIARQQIEEDYGRISNLQSDKLQAGIEVLTSNAFEVYWHVFGNICHAFCNIPISFEDFDPLMPEEIIIGMAQASIMRNDVIEFDDEINKYVGMVFHDHGYSQPPDLFPSAIMPKGNQSDDQDKNKWLDELFTVHSDRCANYLANITL